MKRVVCLLLFVAPLVFAQTWTPETSLKVKTVGEVRVSPDGSRVVYTVGESVMTDDKSEVVRQIWLAKSDGSEEMQLTFGEKSSNAPQWMPDGSGIVFTSSRGDGKTSQLYLLRLRGGEAEPLTSGKSNVAAFAIAPDGKSIAFSAADFKEDEEKKSKAKDDYRWVDEDPRHRRLYVVPLATNAEGKREPHKLVSGDFSVGAGDTGNGPQIEWSPDSKRIAFIKQKSTSANDWPTADIAIVDIDGGEMKPISATKAAEFSPVFSPDGKWMAMVVSDDPPTWGFASHVEVIRTDGTERKALTSTFDVQPDIAGFSPDGTRIYVIETRGTIDRLYAIDIAANQVVDVTGGSEVFTATHIHRAGTHVAMSMQAADRPAEVYVSRLDRLAPVQVSHANDAITKMPTAKTDVIRWKSKDGLDVEGLLTLPIGYKTGTRVPMLLVIHGGPAGVFRQTFVGNYSPYNIAMMAQNGYAVLRVNPRGSSGYGQKFRFANYNDWGGGDYEDLMSGVDHVIAMGVADPDRLGVMGWSYGGFMTSWVIGHTNRFKAASVGAGVTNLISFTGTADIPSFIPDYFGGQYWETFDAWRQHSPIMHVKGVKTPTLIQHGEADERVPISQGYELYNALKAQGVPVRMLVLPRQPHGVQEPKMRLIAMKSNLEWFDKWLRGDALR